MTDRGVSAIRGGGVWWLVVAVALALCLLAPYAAVRAYAAFALVFVMPGLWLARPVARDWAEAIPLGFCFSLLALVPAAIVGFAAETNVITVVGVYAGTLVLAFALIRLPARRWPAPPGPSVAVFVLAVGWMLLAHVYGAHQNTASADSVSTVILIRNLLETPGLQPVTFLLDRPFLDATASSYQIWFLAIAMLAKVATVDPIDAYINLPTVLSPLFLLAFFVFLRALFDDARTGLVGALLLVWFFGIYAPKFTQFMPWAMLVSMVALFLAQAAVVRGLEHGSRAPLYVASALAFVATLVYLGSFFTFIVAMGAMAVWMWLIAGNRAAAWRISVAMGLAALACLPYFAIYLPFYAHDQAITTASRPHTDVGYSPIFGWRTSGFLDIGGWHIVDPRRVLYYFGGFDGWRSLAVMGGLLAMPLLWAGRKRPGVAYVASSMAAVPLMLFNPPIVEAMLAIFFPGKIVKFVPMLAVWAGLAGAAYGIRRLLASVRPTRLSRRVVLPAAVVTAVLMGTFSWSHLNALAERYFQSGLGQVFVDKVLNRNLVKQGFLASPPEAMATLRSVIEPGSVVASVSMRIAAFMHVYLPKVQGNAELKALFDPSIPIEQTVREMRRLGVDYVLDYSLPEDASTKYPPEGARAKYMYNKLGLETEFLISGAKFTSAPRFFRPLVEKDGWVLYRLNYGDV